MILAIFVIFAANTKLQTNKEKQTNKLQLPAVALTAASCQSYLYNAKSTNGSGGGEDGLDSVSTLVVNFRSVLSLLKIDQGRLFLIVTG